MDNISKFIPRMVLILLVIYIFFVFFQPIEIEDVWWHLKTGQWIWEHKSIPDYDLFDLFSSFNNVKTHWLCNYEWFGSVIYYLVYFKFGFLGLKIFRSSLFLFIIGIFYFYARRTLPSYLLFVLIFILTYGCSQRYFLRPDAFNYIFIQLFLIILFLFEKTSKRKLLLLLPLLGVVWVNLHLGSFVYGISLIGIFLIAALVRFFYSKMKYGYQQAQNYLFQAKYLLFTLFVYLLMFFLTPYGLEGFLYPFRAFMDKHFIHIDQIMTMVQESMPPSHFDYRLIMLLLLAVIFMYLNKKNLSIAVVFLFVVSLCFYLKSQRNIAFFFILALYGIVENAGAISFKEKFKDLFKTAYINMFLTLFSLFLLFSIYEMATQQWYTNGKFIRHCLIEEDPRFSEVREFLQANDITGPVYINHDIFGGWLIWCGFQQWKPFIDTRDSNNDRFRDFNLIGLFPQKNWSLAEKKYGFKIAIIDSWYPFLGAPITQYINQLSDWQLIHVSGPILVYVKKGQFHLSDGLSLYASNLKSLGVQKKDIVTLKGLYIDRLEKGPWDMTNQLSSDTDIFLSGAALYSLGYKEAGVKDLIKSLEIGKDPELLPFTLYVLKDNIMDT